jgi:hypothetical protein
LETWSFYWGISYFELLRINRQPLVDQCFQMVLFFV